MEPEEKKNPNPKQLTAFQNTQNSIVEDVYYNLSKVWVFQHQNKMSKGLFGGHTTSIALYAICKMLSTHCKRKYYGPKSKINTTMQFLSTPEQLYSEALDKTYTAGVSLECLDRVDSDLLDVLLHFGDQHAKTVMNRGQQCIHELQI